MKKVLGISFVCIICLLFGLAVFNAQINQRSQKANRKATEEDIPQVEEIFEQTKDNLDTLVNGEFMLKNAWVDYRLLIGTNDIQTTYSDWNEIKWLSEDEKDAAYHLISSPELDLRFLSVSCNDGVMEAILYKSPQIVSIVYKNEDDPPYNGIVQELGNNYFIVVYGPLKRY